MRIDGLGDLFGRFKNMEQMHNSIKKATDQALNLVSAEAKLRCPVGTGELRQSIQSKIEEKGDQISGIVYTNKEHGVYVEMGTGPVGQANHSGISPKVQPGYTQESWSYFDEKNQKWVYTKGQPARPFLYPALKNNEERIKEIYIAAVRKEN